MVPTLDVRCLGRFEVRRGTEIIPQSAWHRRKAGELFRLLLVSRARVLSCGEAAEALAPGRTADSSLDFLHHATSALRHALEPEIPEKSASHYLRIDHGMISLVLPKGSRVDFEEFEQLVRLRRWEDAIRLYGGDLFPDNLAADWAAAPRERLARQYLRAQIALAQSYLETGRAEEALDVCYRVLSSDAWQEPAVFLGMQALLRLDDRIGAIRLYHNLARTLEADLGIAPRKDIQALYRSIAA